MIAGSGYSLAIRSRPASLYWLWTFDDRIANSGTHIAATISQVRPLCRFVTHRHSKTIATQVFTSQNKGVLANRSPSRTPAIANPAMISIGI
jgi:hypothetical protein